MSQISRESLDVEDQEEEEEKERQPRLKVMAVFPPAEVNFIDLIE